MSEKDTRPKVDMSKMLLAAEGNEAFILRTATLHATIGTQVLVATPDGTYVIDKVQIRENGSIVIRCKEM